MHPGTQQNERLAPPLDPALSPPFLRPDELDLATRLRLTLELPRQLRFVDDMALHQGHWGEVLDQDLSLLLAELASSPGIAEEARVMGVWPRLSERQQWHYCRRLAEQLERWCARMELHAKAQATEPGASPAAARLLQLLQSQLDGDLGRLQVQLQPHFSVGSEAPLPLLGARIGPSTTASSPTLSASALARAVAYKGQPYRGLVGPNELELAAVRAPDGSLIYLVDPSEGGLYDTDFNLQTASTDAGGLLRIDHMAMALPADSLDSWVLFYKSLLDFEADDEVVLPDPYGLVKSRALRSRCSSIRLPLNISENRNTAISHALSSYRGSGVHHIAFDCDDIFAQVSRAKEAGVPLLDIPLNYYDDLAARFDFDDEFLSELAYYNVLYDRDAQGGELFHVYTEPFEGRFFFEIIQRKNGYAGYGAANVAVRLAAMAKSRSGAVRQAKL